MIQPSDAEKLIKLSDVVISDSNLGILAHKELFTFKDELYILLKNEFFSDSINKLLRILNSSLNSHPLNMHLVFGWQNLIQVSMWKLGRYSNEDLHALISSAGVNLDEEVNINISNIQEIFDNLLMRGQFGAFRRICHSAKKQFDIRLQDKSIQTICYLISKETKRIVASSL